MEIGDLVIYRPLPTDNVLAMYTKDVVMCEVIAFKEDKVVIKFDTGKFNVVRESEEGDGPGTFKVDEKKALEPVWPDAADEDFGLEVDDTLEDDNY